MATSAKAGSFTCNASTGNQAITGVGFTPKAVIIYGGELATVSSNNEARRTFGCATAATERWCTTGTDNSRGFGTSNQTFNDRILQLNNTSNTAIVSADFVSFDADGFTINLTVAAAKTLYYLALGGSSLSAYAHTQNTPFGLATGTYNYPATSFEPKCLLTAFGPYQSGATAGTDLITTIGMAEATAQGCNALYTRNTATGSDAQCLQVTNSLVMGIDSTGNININGGLVSFMSNGYSINWTAAGPATTRFGILALGGTTSFKLTTVTAPAATGTQVITGIGFQPVALISTTIGLAATGTPNSTLSRQSVGMGSGTTARNTWGFTNANGSRVASNPDVYQSTANLISVPSTTSGTALAAADWTASSTDGFTLNWGTVNGVSSQVLVLAMGDPFTGVTVAVNGFAGTASLGTVTVAAAAGATLTGFAATGSVGTVTAAGASGSIGVNVTPTGLEATTAVGDPTIAAKATVPVTGVAATGHCGTAGIGGSQTATFAALPGMTLPAPARLYVAVVKFNVLPTLTADHVVTAADPTQPSPWRGIEPPYGV